MRAPLRRLVPVLMVVALVGSLFAVLAAPATARAGDPRTDHYELPRGCAGPARTEAQSPQGCRLTPWVASRPTVVLWGDSHAWQQIPGVLRAAKARKVNLTAFVMGKCPPAQYPVRARYPGKCEQSNALALRYVRRLAKRQRPVQVLLGSHWAGFRQMGRRILEQGKNPPAGYDDFDLRMVRLFHERTAPLFPVLARTRARVAVISQTATCQARSDTAPYGCTLPRRRAILHEAATRRWLAGLTRGAKGKRNTVDVNRGFCGPQRCFGRKDGIYTFWDWGHLSETRGRRLARYFVPLLRDLRG